MKPEEAEKDKAKNKKEDELRNTGPQNIEPQLSQLKKKVKIMQNTFGGIDDIEFLYRLGAADSDTGDIEEFLKDYLKKDY